MSDDDEDGLEAMISFLYTGTYTCPDMGARAFPAHLGDQPSDALFEARLHTLADKYNIDALRIETLQKFQTSMKRYWSYPQFAHWLRELMINFRDSHPMVAAVRSTMAEHFPHFAQPTSQNAALQQAVEAELVWAMVHDFFVQKTLQCKDGRCQATFVVLSNVSAFPKCPNCGTKMVEHLSSGARRDSPWSQ